MDYFTNVELQRLIDNKHKFCISIYVPTHRVVLQQRQDRIYFKNIFATAHRKMRLYNFDNTQIAELLDPLEKLLNDMEFMQPRSDGLTIFCASEFFRMFSLPRSFTENIYLGNDFYIRPLLPLLDHYRQFYLITFSKHLMRFYQGNKYELHELYSENIPEGVTEALYIDAASSKLEKRIRIKSSKNQPGVYHGEEIWGDKEKSYIFDYCHHIHNTIKTKVTSFNTPLIFAGVGYLFTIYKKTNSSFNLLDNYVEGNSEHIKQHDLHAHTWSIMEKNLSKEHDKEIQFVIDHINRSHTKASCDVKRIFPASMHGTIDTLLTVADRDCWGTFDQSNDTIRVTDKQEPGTDELINKAVIQTIHTGGKVYTVNQNVIPCNSPVAAYFRY